MNNDTYILQKELPNIPAGTEVTWDSTLTWVNGPYKGGRYGVWQMPSDTSCTQIWTCEDVENNPEWFKKKEQEKPKEWEILEYGYCQNNDNKPDLQYILKVKRLSDGEVFTIGDKTFRQKNDDTISAFQPLSNGEMVVKFQYGFCNINFIEKEKPKEKDVFIWDDNLVAECHEYINGDTAGTLTPYGVMKNIQYFKESKSTPTKIEVIMISLSSKALNYEVSKYEITTSREIPPEKYEQISKAIEQTLNQ